MANILKVSSAWQDAKTIDYVRADVILAQEIMTRGGNNKQGVVNFAVLR
jgi:hypothetical protein